MPFPFQAYDTITRTSHPSLFQAVAIRAKHMHELAILNGTLRDIDNKCLNCGAQGHKTWECKENSIFTASVICNACGGIGHVSKLSRSNGISFRILT